MSKVSDFGIPGSSTGIRQPFLRNRFRVRFYRGEELTDNSDILSMQLVSMSPQTMTRRNQTRQMDLVFQDDVDNGVARALSQELKISNTLTMHIQYLDGNDRVLRTHVLDAAQFISVTFDGLDYAGGISYDSYELAFPQEFVHNELPETFFDGLRGTRLVFNKPQKNGESHIYATISYDRSTIHYPE